jgi:hypothetical protein
MHPLSLVLSYMVTNSGFSFVKIQCTKYGDYGETIFMKISDSIWLNESSYTFG